MWKNLKPAATLILQKSNPSSAPISLKEKTEIFACRYRFGNYSHLSCTSDWDELDGKIDHIL
jgi:hypothetical protein